MAERLPTTITIRVSPLEAEPPFDVSIEGELYAVLPPELPYPNPPLPDKTVDLYRNGSLVKSTVTRSGGVYSFTDRITEAGSYTYYTKFEGDEAYWGCEREW